MNVDITKSKIYLLSTLDPNNGRDDEAEKLIRPFAEKGFRFFNQLVFVSQDHIEKINTHIREKKSDKYQFFLIDITDNLDKETFKGVFSQKHFPIANEAVKIMQVFKPILPELEDKEKANVLFDKIKASGIDSLTQKEKIFLDNFSKSNKQF